MVEDKIILGIDPGTTVLGYGLIHVKNNKLSMVNFGVIQLSKLATHPDKLKRIFDRLDGIIREFKPDEMAIEAPFFGKNVQSMLKLGRAQGVAIAVAMSNGLSVAEYSPKKVKQSITGNGNANKEQIWKMLNSIMPLTNTIKYFDASDALAVAVCHHFNAHGLTTAVSTTTKSKKNRKQNGWEDFIKNNPDRIG